MIVRFRVCLSVCLIFASKAFAILDQNNNQQSDIWETLFGAIALSSSADTDGDGISNLDESVAGTNPLDSKSRPTLSIALSGTNAISSWSSVLGKRYQLFANDTLNPAGWQPIATVSGTGATMAIADAIAQAQQFFHL